MKSTSRAIRMAARVQTHAQQKLDAANYSDDQLELYFLELFSKADKDGNGTLDQSEIKELLSWSGFQFDMGSDRDHATLHVAEFTEAEMENYFAQLFERT